jgi:hypothetical protein
VGTRRDAIISKPPQQLTKLDFIIAKSVQNLYGADRHGAHYVVLSKRVMR